MMTWEGIVTKFHKQYAKEIGINKFIEAYIQSKRHFKVYLLTTEYNIYEEEASKVDRGLIDKVMNGVLGRVESKLIRKQAKINK